ncbi:putative thiol peroxidase [Waddlia chondrophila 2032/99]|uniref:Putative thiol peroxidase n=2 Tax=Waddlia chondrophila TaxID=71667 RepID=D6YTY9_WADCW|nr:thiol peroxidase [Waddlia chondrophila]ADI37600.1 putative thiol peroxidase [Waddlia chondrophila WSU 86-1044]CCB91053.1 putative thiol peroxidase [Waddlia chondrophila 2032/99]
MIRDVHHVNLKAHPVRLEGMLPQIGKKIPSAILTKNDLHEVSLEQFSGKTLILSTAPSFDTPTCAITAKQLYEKLKSQKDLHLLHISCDLPFAQQRFCDEAKFHTSEFLSAFRSSFGKDWGIGISEGVLKGLLARALFVVDPQGILRYTQIVPEITQEPNYEELLNTL